MTLTDPLPERDGERHSAPDNRIGGAPMGKHLVEIVDPQGHLDGHTALIVLGALEDGFGNDCGISIRSLERTVDHEIVVRVRASEPDEVSFTGDDLFEAVRATLHEVLPAGSDFPVRARVTRVVAIDLPSP